MTEEEAVVKWKQSAERNFLTAKDLFAQKHYDWALFIGQLTLEKLLKGLVVKQTHEPPPHIHDLTVLARLAGVGERSINQNDELVEITRFHIQARYDDIKYELYKTATDEYAKKWFGMIEEYYLWLNQRY
jgi:HEPN domain-containing protein